MISFSEKKKIITEFRYFTNADPLTCQQCSFCGGDQPKPCIKSFKHFELDIDIFLEEQCIAWAHATRCTVKLEKGPTGQYASQGNVCIFPQEWQALADVLPPPINVFYDEIAVMLVSSSNSLVTEDMLSCYPLLVWWGQILAVLQWLKVNNPLYTNVQILVRNFTGQLSWTWICTWIFCTRTLGYQCCLFRRYIIYIIYRSCKCWGFSGYKFLCTYFITWYSRHRSSWYYISNSKIRCYAKIKVL